MRVLLIGPDSDSTMRPIALEAGLVPVDDASHADAIICHGGDGTLLGAERDYPGIPKIPMRRSTPDVGVNIAALHLRSLRRVAAGEMTVTRLGKLEARCRGERLVALNDVVIHNSIVTSAVRYRVLIDGVEHFSEIVGDGVVLATPFGSSAYYRSITNSVIYVGIGLAFSNSTEPVNHVVIDEESRVDVRITRGPAVVAVDNCPRLIPLDRDDEVSIVRAPEVAILWEIENLVRMPNHEVATASRVRWLHPRQPGRE